MDTNEKNVLNLAFAQEKYETARKNLLLMIIFTAVNVVLLILNADVMMLFSATVPYMAAAFGFAWQGTGFSMVCFTIAVITVVLYVLCWYMSKKRYGWMIVALVMFILDTLAMAGMYLGLGEISGILDVVIHAWVLYYLIIGVKYGKQIRGI